ncbi:PREDICTED: 28S ribosomal protein S29, mitochondrial [Fragaria vesca subsp. vesca]|uniref:28S ribosomal protein S29, mitochondrial n=1 Tax=Fragaria vesca subsp. vesca TaxID=101020 RepID=UPI0002C2F3EC|nr:PREDICTED: 28S ribosomal protein S29, mitochondrial [Fragaria vesca subsp. vesca]
MLRTILRRAIATGPRSDGPWRLTATASYSSSKDTKSTMKKAKKNIKSKKGEASAAADDESYDGPDADLFDDKARARRLQADETDPSLDVGPNGRPLFTSTPTLAQLTTMDTCSYFKFKTEELNKVLPEGLPLGMVREFEEAMQSAVLVRRSFLDLRDNFRRVVDPPLGSASSKGEKVKKQIVLDGPVSSGKSTALAMLVHWAREEGWLVLYVPRGKDWTHGGFFYKNPQTGLWDTPVQAENILKDFLKFNESRLKQLLCQISDPIPLGEGAGVGWMKDGIDSMVMPEGSTLYDLVDTGIKHTHAAVGVVVRLRKELSLVKDIPVLIAIDQYNNWFTFSEYEEAVTVRSTRPIHAKELATVKAFRSMIHDDMMVGAFSHSTAVGKLRQDLPDVPSDARMNLPRYTLDEAAAVCHYYLRQRLIRREAFSEENCKRIYYLSNGNGAEMRWLATFMREQ